MCATYEPGKRKVRDVILRGVVFEGVGPSNSPGPLFHDEQAMEPCESVKDAQGYTRLVSCDSALSACGGPRRGRSEMALNSRVASCTGASSISPT